MRDKPVPIAFAGEGQQINEHPELAVCHLFNFEVVDDL
jgi:hypothetical protein